MVPTPTPAPRSERDFSAQLTRALGVPVRVRYGRARRHVVVVRPDNAEGSWKGALELRLNHLFAEAPDDVVEALAAWLRSGRRARRACALLDEWIAELGERLSRMPRKAPRIRTRGTHHDLQDLLDELLAEEFDERSLPPGRVPAVTWGRRSGARARHTLQLGSYEHERALIRIHPVLDQEAVPRFFVRYVLFHELLHAAQHVDTGVARERHHGRAFRSRERRYPDYDAALRWQEQNIGRLIRSARTATPMGRGKKQLERWRQALLFPF
jgi:predicted metal-dependent hydrolase